MTSARLVSGRRRRRTPCDGAMASSSSVAVCFASYTTRTTEQRGFRRRGRLDFSSGIVITVLLYIAIMAILCFLPVAVATTMMGAHRQRGPLTSRAQSGRSRLAVVHLASPSPSPCAASFLRPAIPLICVDAEWKHHISNMVKTALAGGIAGGTGTAVLYPLDSAKTLRQSSPENFSSVWTALKHLVVTRTGGAVSSSTTTTSKTSWHPARAYSGVLTAAVGAVPSSALYFGAYEISKNAIRRRFAAGTAAGEEEPFLRRLWIHAAAAATGNVISSAVFVPKELIKQQMQYHAGRTSVRQTVRLILRKSGIRGLYCGYSTVLLRNIPSAALRFCLYEEFRRAWYDEQSDGAGAGAGQWSWKLFAAGAVAGAIASGVMTPVDVLKTRLSTGTCPIVTDPLGGNPVVTCVQHVVRENGWKALYAGAGSRMLFSGAFSAVGFGTFEAAKKWLRVSPSSPVNKQ